MTAHLEDLTTDVTVVDLKAELERKDADLADLRAILEPIWLAHANAENRTMLQTFVGKLPDRMAWLGLKTLLMGLLAG